jgi:hypothetical protein
MKNIVCCVLLRHRMAITPGQRIDIGDGLLSTDLQVGLM